MPGIVVASARCLVAAILQALRDAREGDVSDQVRTRTRLRTEQSQSSVTHQNQRFGRIRAVPAITLRGWVLVGQDLQKVLWKLGEGT